MKSHGWSADEFIALAEEELDEAVQATNAPEDYPPSEAGERVARAQVFATLAAAQATIEAVQRPTPG